MYVTPRSLLRTLLPIFLYTILPAVGLFAQEEGVVITASRIPESYKSTPGVLEVIDREELAKATTLLDALSDLPEIQVVSSSPGSRYVTMGGFGEAGFARVLVLRNGVPQNRPDLDAISWLAIPLERIERVEILKGGGSALYGDQAVAGVINIITRSPGEPELSVSAAVDTNLSNRQSFSFSHQPGILGYAVNVTRESLRPARDRSDAEGAHISGELHLVEGPLSAALSLFYEPSSQELPGGIGEDAFQEAPNQATNRNDEVDELSYGLRLEGELDLYPLSISLPVSYRRNDTIVDFESLGSYSNGYLDDFDLQLQGTQEYYLGDIVLLTAILGFDFAAEFLTVERFASSDRESETFAASINRNSYASWIRGKLSVGEYLFLESGVRYELATLEGASEQADLDEEVSHTPFVADIGVAYLPAEPVKLSLRYSRLFRYPLLDEQASYFGFGGDEIYTDIDPEEGHSVTAGVELLEGDLRASIAPYLTVMDEEILYDPALFRNVNGGETLRFGGAVDAAWESRFVELGAGYSYDRAVFTAGDRDGKRVPLVPAHTLRGAVEVQPVATVSLSTGLRWEGEYYEGGDFLNNSEPVDGRTVWDARLAWTPVEETTLFVAGKNLLNDRAPSRVYYGSWYPEEERRFELGARWTY